METEEKKPDPFDAAVLRVLQERVEMRLTVTTGINGRLNIGAGLFLPEDKSIMGRGLLFGYSEIELDISMQPTSVMVSGRMKR